VKTPTAERRAGVPVALSGRLDLAVSSAERGQLVEVGGGNHDCAEFPVSGHGLGLPVVRVIDDVTGVGAQLKQGYRSSIHTQSLQHPQSWRYTHCCKFDKSVQSWLMGNQDTTIRKGAKAP
jgi:hypothetical protein